MIYFLCVDVSWCFFFFFKQKTAYEMRISDWSSDVCSSDLGAGKVCVTGLLIDQRNGGATTRGGDGGGNAGGAIADDDEIKIMGHAPFAMMRAVRCKSSAWFLRQCDESGWKIGRAHV